MADDPNPLLHVDWIRWLQALKSAVERPISGVSPEQITMTAPHLLGRTTAGTGGAEEISVSGPLTLAALTLGITGSALTKTDDTNVTLTLGGAPTTALLGATSLTLGWTGVLSVARGGTGTGTALTQGSVVFAGASGVLSQDNVNFFWDDAANSLGLGTTSIAARLTLRGTGSGSSTKSVVVEDSAGADMLSVRDDGATAFGKNVTLPSAAGFYYLASNADFSNAFTVTNNINGISSPVGAIQVQIRYAGNQEFGRGEAVSIISESTNTHSGNFISAFTGSARIASAGGLATQLAGATLTARTNDATSGTVTTMIGVRVGCEVNHASVTATTAYGFQVADLVNLGTIGNTYGVHVGDVTAGTQTNNAFSFYASDANAFNYFAGRVGCGVTAPTAVLHLKAGTTAASTAPLKFTSGTLQTTAEAGAVEFLTDAFYGTITTGAARKTFAFLESPAFTTPNIGAASGSSLSLSNTINLIATGTAATAGTATLVAGTVTVNTTAMTATAVLFLQRKTSGGTIGFGWTYTQVNGTSFTVTSDSVLDTSTFVWMIVETH